MSIGALLPSAQRFIAVDIRSTLCICWHTQVHNDLKRQRSQVQTIRLKRHIRKGSLLKSHLNCRLTRLNLRSDTNWTLCHSSLETSYHIPSSFRSLKESSCSELNRCQMSNLSRVFILTRCLTKKAGRLVEILFRLNVKCDFGGIWASEERVNHWSNHEIKKTFWV